MQEKLRGNLLSCAVVSAPAQIEGQQRSPEQMVAEIRRLPGQQAIEKRYADEIASSPGNLVEKLVQLYGIGDEITAISEWSKGVWKGYKVRIYVRDLDTWKIRMEYAILSMMLR